LRQAAAPPARDLGFYPLAVADIRRETPRALSVAFAVPPHLAEAFRFIPGQYLTLRAIVDGEDVRRSYSICSGIDDRELRIAIKRLDGGAFSAFVHDGVARGDVVDVMPPMGRFTHIPDPNAAGIYVAFAAGSGITPVMSLMKSVLSGELRSRFALFYGNRARADIIFREGLGDLKDRFVDRLSVTHVLSREHQEIPALNGRLDGEKVALLLRTLPPVDAIDRAFVCGPAGMIASTEIALAQLGMPPERILIERFTPAPGGRRRPPTAVVAEPEALPVAVADILLGGVRSEVPVTAGETVLDAGLRAGLDMPYSCHGGMCCTCRAKLLQGEVDMDVNYSLAQWELDAGYVLTCQSHPTTARVAVDYDQV
jgi:ring-1,2-phenylacetyl-CoA epoxidase subunit PaaE